MRIHLQLDVETSRELKRNEKDSSGLSSVSCAHLHGFVFFADNYVFDFCYLTNFYYSLSEIHVYSVLEDEERFVIYSTLYLIDQLVIQLLFLLSDDRSVNKWRHLLASTHFLYGVLFYDGSRVDIK